MSKVIFKIGDVYHKHQFSSDDESASLTVGRAFTNDFILADPYVGPSQLEFRLASDSEYDWYVNNIDDTNPTFLNNKVVDSPGFSLRSGDEVTIGRTNFTVYSEDHVIPKTRRFSFTNWLHHHKFKPLIAIASLMLLFAVSLWMAYLETSSEPDGGELSEAAIGMVILAILWSSGWSFAGRLLEGQHYFFSHLFFTALCFSFMVITGDLYSYVDYIFSSLTAGQVVDWLLSTVLFGLLIGFNLALVTYSPKAFRNGLIAGACIMAVAGSIGYLAEKEYSNQPVHSATIKPSYVPTTAPVSVEVYVERYDAIFNRLSSAD